MVCDSASMYLIFGSFPEFCILYWLLLLSYQEATGAVLVSREPNKLIIYRGWPAGEQRPDMVTEDENVEEVSQELRAAILSEEVRDPMDFSYLTREECSLVGIEYTGNGTEEQDEEPGEELEELEQEDEANASSDMWNPNENWSIEGKDEDEDDTEAETCSSKLDAVEADWYFTANAGDLRCN